MSDKKAKFIEKIKKDLKEIRKQKELDRKKELIKKLKNDEPNKKEAKVIENIKSVIKKIKDPYLNLMYYNSTYYLVEYCEHNIKKLLTLRNPKYIIIDFNNNYDTMLIEKIPKIEYLTNLKNYGINLIGMANHFIIYNNHYNYKLVAYSQRGINIYKNIDKNKTPVLIPPILIIKKEFIKEEIKIEDPKKNKCANKIISLFDDDKKSSPKKQSSPKRQSLSKEDYIKEIKKIYPYYEDLDLDKLNCETINLKYNINSCYMDSLFVALFNSKNPLIKELILNSKLHNYKNSKLDEYGEQIREQLKLLYKNITKPPTEIGTNKCTVLRSILQHYQDRYKQDVNSLFQGFEWTSEQNDFSDLLTMLQVIFDIPFNMDYSLNGRIEKKSFFDFNNDIDLFTSKDTIKINNYYPSYTKRIDLDGTGNIRIEKIEYVSAPLLLIKINRIIQGVGKILKPVIPELKIKLQKNNLYLNSIIIHYGDENSGHYICLFECKGQWYEFDDLRGYSKLIGPFNKVLSNDNYLNNIVGLLYYSLLS